MTAEIVRSLRTLLVPGQVGGVVGIFEKVPKPKDGPPNYAKGFCSDDVEKLAGQAAVWDRGNAVGVYFVLNPLKPDLAGRTVVPTIPDVSRRQWLFVDVDPHRPAQTPSTDTERWEAWRVLEACRGTLDGMGFGASVVCDSGNGFHLLYPINLPNDHDAVNASRELVKAVLVGLQKRCGTDKATVDTTTPATASTICKLYGTVARKGPNTAERPHRKSWIVEGTLWDETQANHNNGRLKHVLEMWAHIDDLRKGRPTGDVLSRAKAYVAKEPVAVSGKGGHNTTFHVACQLVKGFGLDADQAFEAIQDWNRRCEPPWSAKELRHKIADALKRPGEVGTLLNGQTHSNGHREQPPPVEPEEIDANDVATIADLERCGAEVRWLWPGWIQVGVLNIIAAEGGTGKTRFCADLLRRIQYGLLWPDGMPITAPQDSLSLWVLADNHHDEIVTLARDFGIKESIRLNATKADPYGGVSLDDPADLKALEGRIKVVKPVLVIVDTVGNATDKNLSKQEDAKAFYQPLQLIARRQHCAILCLTHLSAGGHVLGRRAKEKVRVVIQMEKPDAGDERRKVWVSKSNTKYPAPLGVTMGGGGNEYDGTPPSSKEADDEPVKECREWLLAFLKDGPKKVGYTRIQAEKLGFSAGTLYRAKDSADIEQFEAESRKWWRLTLKKDAAS